MKVSLRFVIAIAMIGIGLTFAVGFGNPGGHAWIVGGVIMAWLSERGT